MGLIVFLYLPLLFSLAKLETKTIYKLLIAFVEVLTILIIAAYFWTMMYLFHARPFSLGVVVGQILALVLSLIVNGIILIVYNMVFLSPRRKNKAGVLIFAVGVMILVHFIFSFSFGWKTVHNDDEHRYTNTQAIVENDTLKNQRYLVMGETIGPD